MGIMDQAQSLSSGGMSVHVLSGVELGHGLEDGRRILHARGVDQDGVQRSARMPFHDSRSDVIAGLGEESRISGRSMTIVGDLEGGVIQATSMRSGSVSVTAEEVKGRDILRTFVRGARGLLDSKSQYEYENEAREIRRIAADPQQSRLREAAATKDSDLNVVSLDSAKASVIHGREGLGSVIEVTGRLAEGNGPEVSMRSGRDVRVAIPFSDVHGDRAAAMADRITRLGVVEVRGSLHEGRDHEGRDRLEVAAVEARSGDARIGRESTRSSPLKRIVRTVSIQMGTDSVMQEMRAVEAMRSREGR